MSRGPILIGMASLKGRVGKTTSAVHIAGRFAEQGRNILMTRELEARIGVRA